MNKQRKILVTHALPYANGPLHLGHLLESIQTDIWVRFQNQSGNECLFFCADDTHGTPVMLKAKELDISPESLVKNVQKDHINTYDLYNINFTNFHTTHSDENKKYSEEIYESSKEDNLISKKVVNQYFDTEEGIFLSDRFIKGECPKCSSEDQYGDGCEKCGATYNSKDLINPVSVISNSTPELRDSEHIFFDLPKKRKMLEGFLKKADIQTSVKNKLNEWMDDLRPWDISRDAPYFGFEIPNEKNKYFYVWLDAPIGYIASLANWASNNSKDINEYWSDKSDYEIVHFIGKDIAYFHCLFWPAILDSSNFKKPDSVYVHGFLTINGEKMSKSKGTGITTEDFAKHCDPELLRYYLASKLNDKVEDVDLNIEDLSQRINSDLVGKYLNIASRSSTFIEKNKGFLSSKVDKTLLKKIKNAADEIRHFYDSRQYSKAVRLIMDMADHTNKYINDKKPWKLSNNEAAEVATTATNAFRLITIYLSPILPKLTFEAFKLLGLDNQDYSNINDDLVSITINKYEPLLQRMEALTIEQFKNEEINMSNDENSNDVNTININQFMETDLRVAKIVNAEDIEDADKLIKLTLSVGDIGTKTVFAGIKSAYKKEDLLNKMVILVNNLAARKMKFGVSEGMVLASSDDNGGIFLISPDKGAKEGQKVK
ncbi:MAG: methionine--tRNA ligase [SAR86 cluster bacterium]|uniref:Methionine--tRNA ligase n=1 Tax=SAR86 cluster bacterium TaxID=2030880 RepID=A0A520M7M9_9GAMM|nr:MAG: methionine--tRNA ligase [SAR86 cluster bacterium]